jgi:hypothetical protein
MKSFWRPHWDANVSILSKFMGLENFRIKLGFRLTQVLFFSMLLPAHSGPWPLTQFRNIFSQKVELLRRVISLSQGHYLNTRQHKHRINSYTYTHQTSMSWVGFEPTIPASEREKTVHVLDRAVTVTDSSYIVDWSNSDIKFLHLHGVILY